MSCGTRQPRASAEGYGTSAQGGAVDFGGEVCADGARGGCVYFRAGHDFETGDDIDRLAVAGEVEETADVWRVEAGRLGGTRATG